MKKKGLAKTLNFIGILLMVAIILILVPLTVPKLFGVRIYGVLTGSMTPTYPIGGVIYVVEKEAEAINEGDVITFRMGTDTEHVMTHRVVEIEGNCFITKGDANEDTDPEPVAFERLIGRVAFYLPGLAKVTEFVNSVTGGCVMIMLFAAAFILFIMADMIGSGGRKAASNDNSQGASDKIEPSMSDAKGQSVSDDSEKTAPDERKEKKQNRGKIGQIAGVILMLGAGAYLAVTFLGYEEATEEYAALEQEVFGMSDERDTAELMLHEGLETENLKANTDNLQPDADKAQKDTAAEEERILQAITKLHEENEDVVGWIKFEQMDISYPIMQGEDNDYYLEHTYKGKENSSGSIFMEALNASDFTDAHTIIYGHNMKNGSMFGSLQDFKKQGHYEENTYFTIYTLEGAYRYQIFAYYDISMYGDVYQIHFKADDAFQSFIDTLISRSYYDTGVKPVKTDKIVTLSTCSTVGNRFVVNGVRVQK